MGGGAGFVRRMGQIFAQRRPRFEARCCTALRFSAASRSKWSISLLPIVPDFVRTEIDGARRHYEAKERCVFCDIIRQEEAAGRRIIYENAEIIAIAPYAPRFPFETWLLPRAHGARFEEAPRQQYEGLARVLKAVLMRMDKVLEKLSFNLIVHSAPFTEAAAEYYHWHVELIPKLARTAGFEWGSGF